MRLNYKLCCLIMALLGFTSLHAQNAVLQGTVNDATNGNTPLVGATVKLLKGGSVVTGAATDANGKYTIRTNAGTYDVEVTSVGYVTVRQTGVALAANQTKMMNLSISEDSNILDGVVVTASRQAEKILDAPASVSVLDAKEVSRQATPNVAAVLRNVEGVDVAQTGVDRYEIVLRGFNNAFSGAAYTLIDYRQGAIASLNANAHSMMPISNIDMERIEIVRGPGSALYGPGVDSGVIHFITKNPFDHKGTTISIGGGQQSTISTAWRHAGVVANNKLGYKIAGQYSKATEFAMDPTNPLDFAQMDTNGDGLVVLPNGSGLQAFKVNAAKTAAEDVTSQYQQTTLQSSRDVPREADAGKFNMNGMIEYKIKPKTSIIANAGYAISSGTYQSGIGNLYAKNFGYTYGQLRFQSGNFFMSGSINKNAAGDSYIIGYRRLDSTGKVVQGTAGSVLYLMAVFMTHLKN